VAQVGSLSERAPVGNRARGLQPDGRRLELLQPRSIALPGLPVGRRRPRGHLGRRAATLLRARAVERRRPHHQGAALRPDQQRRQPRRRRQGVLLLSRLDADALVHEIPVQVPALRLSLREHRQDQRAAEPSRDGVRAHRHRMLRRRPLLRRVRGVRQGLAGGRAGRDHGSQSRSGARDAARRAHALVPQHLVVGRHVESPEPPGDARRIRRGHP
jgi:hypothetical protein